MSLLETLKSHVKPLTSIDAYDEGEAILCMFDEHVHKVFEWREDNYQGSVFVVYKLDDMFIYGHGSFGSCSGCDSWIDATPQQKQTVLEDLLNGFQSVHQISDIAFGKYIHSELRQAWYDFVRTQNTGS